MPDAKIEQLRDQVRVFYSACCYLDKAIPVFGYADNGLRIRAATDQILELRAALAEQRERADTLQKALDSRCVKVGEYYIGNHPAGGYWIEHESGEGMQGGQHFEDVIHDYYRQNF